MSRRSLPGNRICDQAGGDRRKKDPVSKMADGGIQPVDFANLSNERLTAIGVWP